MLANIWPGSARAVLWRGVMPGCAGLLGSLALPPWDIWPALPVAFSALVWILDHVARHEASVARRCRAAAMAGWSWGIGWFIFSLSWVAEAFRVESDIFAWLIPFVVILLPAGLALYWAAATALVMRWWTRGAGDLLAVVAALSVAEWLRGHLLSGFPWNLPGYAADASAALAQTASVTGIYGLTMLVLVWSLIPAMLWRPGGRPAFRLAAVSLVALGLCWAGGTWRLSGQGPGLRDDVSVSIVQASIPQTMKWKRERRDDILARYLDLTARVRTDGASGRPVIIWPETALPDLVAELPDLRQQIADGLPPDGVLIFGAIRREPAPGGFMQVFNSVLVIDKAGSMTVAYDKHRLVPFGEFLPFESVLAPLGLRKLVPVPLSFTAGRAPAPVAIAGLPGFLALICYEAIFPLAASVSASRVEWLVNVTNDAWFGTSAGPAQHLAQARFRSIEQGIPLLRAANTGISAVIDSRGNVLKRLDLGVVGVLTTPLPRPAGPTLYGRFGDKIFVLLIAGLVGGAIGFWRKCSPESILPLGKRL